MQPARKYSLESSPGFRERPYRNPVYLPNPQRNARKVKLVCLLVSCFLLSLVVVAQYSSLVIANYRISGVRAEIAVIQEQSKQLELEVARLSSIGLIEEIARTDLGMVEPELDQLIIITAGRVLNARIGE